MVFDPSTGAYVPVIYMLMTHKNQELYWQVFNQVKVLTKSKMNVMTYTSDFERAEMNTLEMIFGGPGKGKHVGCLFHIKQAWLKYLKEKCNLAQSPSLEGAMAMDVGGIDLLCILPRNEVVKFGIPYVCWTIETGTGLAEWEKAGYDKFWEYFVKQWVPIMSSWNVREDDGSLVPNVNRTNNALERYNRRMGKKFLKKPSLIEFVVEEESRFQAEKLQDIRIGRCREAIRPTVWVAKIEEC